MIPFNLPALTGKELDYLKVVMNNRKFSGDGEFTRKCCAWLKKNTGCSEALLTTSGTHALEMAAMLLNIREGDEVIMPSYTFSSTANAFILRGARLVFVDIRPDTMNIDEKLIKKAITRRTKAIVVMHYAGIACEMGLILRIAKSYGVAVVEDAAHALLGKYNGEYLGAIGGLGCYSFHETKNCSCGEGGALIINDREFMERAEIIREKGTDRSKFWRGEVDKYSWVDIGSSYLLGELNAAFLYAQLENARQITNDRLRSWNVYYSLLEPVSEKAVMELPVVPAGCLHNGHLFYIKVKGIRERDSLIGYLKKRGILSVFHYIPLHSSKAGKKFGSFFDVDRWTTRESERLVRLPLYYGIKKEAILHIASLIKGWLAENAK